MAPVSAAEPNTRERISSLLYSAQSGDTASRDRLVADHMRLVRFMARKHARSRSDFEDLSQEGVFGLMVAIERFDHRPETEFKTYAAWCIRGAFSRYYRNIGSIVRIPANTNVFVIRLRRRLERHPAESSEVAVMSLGLTESAAHNVLTAFRQSVRSLDVQRANDEGMGSSLQDSLRSVSGLDPEQAAIARSLYEEVRGQLADLHITVMTHPRIKSRNAQMFAQKLGLADGYVGRTLESLSHEHGVTRERVRQIIARVWWRVRYSTPITDATFTATVERYRDLEELVYQ